MSLDTDISTVMQDHKVARTLTLYMPESIVGSDKESLVRDICTMAIAGIAVKAADDLLKNHGIENVVLTTS